MPNISLSLTGSLSQADKDEYNQAVKTDSAFTSPKVESTQPKPDAEVGSDIADSKPKATVGRKLPKPTP